MILKALSKPFNEGTGHVGPELLAPLVSMAGAVVRDGNLTDLAMLLSAAARLGRLARRLLEEGRCEFLRERGFEVTLVRYVDASVTPDNLAIIARRPARQVPS